VTRPLSGCTVVVTREQRGELGRLLDAQGADVVHVPLIEVVDADLTMLAEAWRSEPEWVIVTSAAGAERVAADVADRPGLALAAVGTATARRLEERCGRPADLVPDRQLATALVEEFVARNDRPRRVLVAQADRAEPTLVDGLRSAGHEVTAVVAYRTLLRRPSAGDLASIARADAMVFTSGSAALSWADAVEDPAAALPPIVVAIGPTTSAAAAESGLKVSHVAADQSLAGVIDELIDAWGQSRAT
jgi:uroporphyrinogen-III synthase